jgi:4-amino-4-deoxy-L-arabinose transferase-like glycosyltransferase
MRYGWESRLGMVENVGLTSSDSFTFTFHYPPLFPLIWALFWKVFGVNEWSARLMAVVFSLGSICVFYKIIDKYFGVKTAIVTCLFWIFTPMFVYYGKMPVHEIPLMFFVLLAFYFYLINRYPLTAICSGCAMLITWPGYFIIPAITAHWVVFRKFRHFKLKQIMMLWVIAIGLFGLFLTHNYLVTGSIVGGGVREIFLLRVGEVALVPYLSILVRWMWTYYFLLVPLAILGLIFTRNHILFLFLAYAIVYPIIFRDASFRHDYLLIYFFPWVTLGAAILTTRIIKRDNFLAILVVAILMFTIIFRGKFILALLDSNIYKESVKLGKYVNSNSSPTEKVLILADDPNVGFDGWFVSFYADRATGATSSFSTVFSYKQLGLKDQMGR